MKSCPKCSSMGVVIKTGRQREFYAVKCSHCDLPAHIARTEDEAIAIWNKRRARKKNDPTFKRQLRDWYTAKRAFLELTAGTNAENEAKLRLEQAEDELFRAAAFIY